MIMEVTNVAVPMCTDKTKQSVDVDHDEKQEAHPTYALSVKQPHEWVRNGEYDKLWMRIQISMDKMYIQPKDIVLKATLVDANKKEILKPSLILQNNPTFDKDGKCVIDFRLD